MPERVALIYVDCSASAYHAPRCGQPTLLLTPNGRLTHQRTAADWKYKRGRSERSRKLAPASVWVRVVQAPPWDPLGPGPLR